MPNSGSSNWILSKWFVRQRSARDPPFFFREVRIGMLVVSMLFNLGRLMYEAIVKDVSVILVAARLCLTAVQLVDHWWFCKNWESFFIEKKMRAYIWFRLFVAVCMLSMTYCVLRTFPPYTNDSRLKQLKIDAFQWAAGLQVFVWYLWGKRWDFNWGDMSDERRIPAIVGSMFTSSLIYGMSCVYNLFAMVLFGMTPGITATVAYFLTGLAFRYLNIVTNRSSEACRKILDESQVAPATDAHNPGSPPLVVKQNSDGIPQPSLLPSHPIPLDGTVYHVDNSGRGSNKSIALNSLNDRDGDNMGSVSASSNVGGDSADSDSVRVKPNNSHTNSNSNPNSIVIESSGPPLCDITDHLMIDHVNIPLPLTRQNSLETNLATYETAHLLSDKIVVVFVQVKLPDPNCPNLNPTLTLL